MSTQKPKRDSSCAMSSRNPPHMALGSQAAFAVANFFVDFWLKLNRARGQVPCRRGEISDRWVASFGEILFSFSWWYFFFSIGVSPPMNDTGVCSLRSSFGFTYQFLAPRTNTS